MPALVFLNTKHTVRIIIDSPSYLKENHCTAIRLEPTYSPSRRSATHLSANELRPTSRRSAN